MIKIDEIGLTRSQIEAIIDERVFNEKHRMILKRRWLDGTCYEPLAEEFDLSVRQTKSIVLKYEDKLLSKL